jgi:hypothetical protein
MGRDWSILNDWVSDKSKGCQSGSPRLRHAMITRLLLRGEGTTLRQQAWDGPSPLPLPRGHDGRCNVIEGGEGIGFVVARCLYSSSQNSFLFSWLTKASPASAQRRAGRLVLKSSPSVSTLGNPFWKTFYEPRSHEIFRMFWVVWRLLWMCGGRALRPRGRCRFFVHWGGLAGIRW